MRKSYGPTGVSAHYPFEKFKTDVKDKPVLTELVIADNIYFCRVDLVGADEIKLQAFYDKADHMSIIKGQTVFCVVAGS